jgi:hypothetical protein
MAIQVGGTQVISNTQGLTNIASVDATTAASISAAGVGGGGTVDFTADGAISAGDVVALNSNGTVSPVAEGSDSYTSPATVASVYSTPNQSFYSGTRLIYDDTNSRVLTAYKESNYFKLRVGSISGTTVTWGGDNSPDTSSQLSYDIEIVYVGSGKIVAFWGQSSNLYARVGTVSSSGTTISWGSEVDTGELAGGYMSAAHMGSGKVFVQFTAMYNFGNETGRAIVGTVSGTSISFGTSVQFTSNEPEFNACVYDPDEDKVAMFYSDNNNSNYGKALVATVSGTSISLGSITTYYSGTVYAKKAVYDTINNKIGLFSTNYPTLSAYAVTISGTSLSFGTAASVGSIAGATSLGAEYSSSAGKFFVSFVPSTSPYYLQGVSATMSGTSFSIGTAASLEDTYYPSQYPAVTYDSNANQFYTVYRRRDTSSTTMTYVTATLAPSNYADWIGVSTQAISDTASGSITVLGGVNDQQTGLTIGSVYYVSPDGTLSTTAGAYKVGKALSATDLLITEANV